MLYSRRRIRNFLVCGYHLVRGSAARTRATIQKAPLIGNRIGPAAGNAEMQLAKLSKLTTVEQGVSENNPIRVFVTHMFEEVDDYLRVFEFLESVDRFYYVNVSKPDNVPEEGGQASLWPCSLRMQTTSI